MGGRPRRQPQGLPGPRRDLVGRPARLAGRSAGSRPGRRARRRPARPRAGGHARLPGVLPARPGRRASRNLSPYAISPIAVGGRWSSAAWSSRVRLGPGRYGWAAAVALSVLATPAAAPLPAVDARRGRPVARRPRPRRSAEPTARPSRRSGRGRSVAPGPRSPRGVVGWVGLVWLGRSSCTRRPRRPPGSTSSCSCRPAATSPPGRSPYDPAIVAGAAPVAESLFYSYPPVVAQVMALVAAVPSPVMFVAWAAAAVAGLAASPRRSAAVRSGRPVALGRRCRSSPSRRCCFPFAIGLLFGNLDVFFPLLYGAMLLGGRCRWPTERRPPDPTGAAAVASPRAWPVAKLHPGSLGLWLARPSRRGRRERPARPRRGRRGRCLAIAGGRAPRLGGIQPWLDYVAVVRAGSSADLVDPRNAGPAAQLALLLGRRRTGPPSRDALQIPVTLGAVAGRSRRPRRGWPIRSRASPGPPPRRSSCCR